MRISTSSRLQLRLATAGFVLLVLAAAALVLQLGHLYNIQFDLTRSGRHSLSDASISAITRLNKPLRITAFASNDDNIRSRIEKHIKAYRSHKPDITLEFINPNHDPERARKARIRFDGQLILHYDNSSETLTSLSEQHITNALLRLGHKKERWIVFLTGHGERDPDRNANFDLSKWAAYMRQQGFLTRSLSLAESGQIPRNTAVLVIAGPQTRFLKGETRAIERYLEQGGNLLWLAEPGPMHGLSPVAEMLGIEFEPGVVVDLQSAKITKNPAALVIERYGNHPALSDFPLRTVLITALALSFDDGPDDEQGQWRAAPLIDTSDNAWSETDLNNPRITYNKGRDIPGPLTLAAALSRTQDDRQQRVIVVGDGDFLANAIIMNNGGNLELGMSLINWLSHNDDYVSIPVRTLTDRTLILSNTTVIFLGIFFLGLLPLGLIAGGLAIWLRRRQR